MNSNQKIFITSMKLVFFLHGNKRFLSSKTLKGKKKSKEILTSKTHQLLAAMTKLAFIVGTFVAEDALYTTVWLSKQLQEPEMDLTNSY